MRQVKVSLYDLDVSLLERAAEKAGRSLSEEIRIRIRSSLSPEMGPREDVIILAHAIARLATWVETQTKRRWHSHPAAIRVLQDAVVARFERLRGGVKDAEFTLDEMPRSDRLVAIVAAADQRTWGPALEAIEFQAHSTEWSEIQGIEQQEEKESKRDGS